MRTVDDVLRMAKSAGVTVLVEGYDLVLEHEADPPPNLVATLRHYKPELVSALRMRQADQRSLITQWVNDHFASSPQWAPTRGPLRSLVRRKRSGRSARLMSSGVAQGARGRGAQGAEDRPMKTIAGELNHYRSQPGSLSSIVTPA